MGLHKGGTKPITNLTIKTDSEPERPHIGSDARVKSMCVEDTGKVSCRWTERKVTTGIEDVRSAALRHMNSDYRWIHWGHGLQVTNWQRLFI